MKPGRGPHVLIGVLASFIPSLGTRLSSSLHGGVDGISQGEEWKSRLPGLPLPLTLKDWVSVPMQWGISHSKLPGFSRLPRAHGAGHAVAEEGIGPRG